MSTLDEMEMPTLTFDPAPEPEEKAPVVPVQEEKAKLEKNGKNFFRIHTRKTRLKKKFMNI